MSLIPLPQHLQESSLLFSLLLPRLDQGPFAPSALISERNVREFRA